MSNQNRSQERFQDTWIMLGLIFLAILLYVPFIGSYSLWDPWEAHYSQVAMEMVWKGSWWEPWYRTSNTSFWSKPIFTFWLMVSSLKSFRVTDFTQAEFYLRLPIALIGSVGVGYMFFFVRNLWGRRPAILSALVLMTSPQYFLISRQIMVDIPFLVVQMAALGFLAMGMFSRIPEDTAEVKSKGIRMSWIYVGLGVSVHLLETIYWMVVKKQSFMQSWLQGSYLWLALAAFFAVWAVVRIYTKSPQTRYFYLFFFFSGLAFLAKGLLSLVLPGGIVLFYILLTGDWALLKRMKLIYTSDKIKLSTSIILGTLSSLLAVLFISYPMFKQLFRQDPWRGMINFKLSMGKTSYLPLKWLKVNGLDPFLALGSNQQITYFALGFLLIAFLLFLTGEKGKERAKAYLFPGMLLYLIIAGSWVYVMNLKHGLPFMREWFIYHHFSRIAGTIEKPNNTFDLYIKQIAFGMFPWSAVIPIAAISFLRWSPRDLLKTKRLRNLFFFCCFFFPYFFFTFSSTKFHHYIFPVVPFLAIMVGVWLAKLFKENGAVDNRIGLGASLILFALLSKDLITNYKPLHQLFTYYTNRTTPPEVFPAIFFKFIFVIMGLVLLSFLLVKRVRYVHFATFLIPVIIFVFFVNIRLIPAVTQNFSFKSLYTEYKKFAPKHCPPLKNNAKDAKNCPKFGEYSNWDERSTSFYFQNFSTYLGRASGTRKFLKSKKTFYIMASKRQIPMLRRLAAKVNQKIYIVSRPHYDMWLVSNKRPQRSGGNSIVLKKMPDMTKDAWKRVNIDFAGKVKMVGVKVDKPNGYKRGDIVKITFLYKVTGKLKRNWRGFIHVDPVKWTRNRLNWDHEMAEGLYPTSEWKVGEYIQDIVKERIPLNYPSQYNKLHIYMGLWLGSDRLPIKSSSVYHDGQNRVRATVLKLLP